MQKNAAAGDKSSVDEGESVKSQLLTLVAKTELCSRTPSLTEVRFTEIMSRRHDFKDENMILCAMRLVSGVMVNRYMRSNEDIIVQGTQLLIDLFEMEGVAPVDVFSMIGWLLDVNNKGERCHIIHLHMMELLEHMLIVGKCECHKEGHSAHKHMNKQIANFLAQDFAVGPLKDCVHRIVLHKWQHEDESEPSAKKSKH